MKLIACHIDNFGKLSNLSLEFKDGMNVINESNAWGKSTLAAFLKAMFYGLDAKKEPKAFEKERVMYRPWQGGAFGGELDFEVEGKCYRISRTFGRTEKTDEFHLYDLSTNLECRDYTHDIGLELFDLDSSSFKRTIYIAQNDCLCESSDYINAKLGDLAQNTDDINNFESAMRRMKDKLNYLTPERVTGSIKKRKSYITELMQEIRSYEAAEEGISRIEGKIQLISSQIEEMLVVRRSYADALVLASEERERKVLYAHYQELCQQLEEKRGCLEDISIYFPKNIPSLNEFKEHLQIANQIDMHESALLNCELTIEERQRLDRLEEKYGQKRPMEEQIEQGNGHKVMLVIALVFIILGILSSILSYQTLTPLFDTGILMIIGIALLCGGGILALIGLGIEIHLRKRSKARINAILAEYNEINQLREYDRLVLKRNESEAEKETLQTLKQNLYEFLECYGFSINTNFSSRLNELQGKALEYMVEKKAYDELCNKKDAFEKSQSKSFWRRDAVCPYSVDELNSMITEVDDKTEKLKKAKNQYERQLEELRNQLDVRDEKRLELEEELERQEVDTKRYNTVQYACAFMSKAKEQLTARYMNPIANSFSKYYQLLTEDVSKRCIIDANIEAKFHEQGEFRDARNLSAGYRDLIGICMRLALVDVMYKAEKPFLILDDPFVNLDKEKVDRGNQMLISVAKNYQIIYFTCHDSRSPKIF